MAASADVFGVTASDSIARQVINENPTGIDITVTATGRLDQSAVAGLDSAMRAELDRVGRLGDPVRTIYTDQSFQEPAVDDTSPPQDIIGSGARFIARDGAIDALDVIEGDRSVEGAWISERVADNLDLPTGSLVSVAGSAPFPIAGVFANLWEGDPDPYWGQVPAPFVPRFSRVFNGPLFEVVIVPESVFFDLDVDGLVRWDSAATELPDTYEELIAQASRTRGLERSYTESAELVEALAAFSGPGGPVPILATDVIDLRQDTRSIVDELDQPIATASIGGIVLGLIVTGAGAAFAIRKRETEVRLLRADGDAPWRFAARALAQFAVPAIVGAALGVVAAWALIAVPDGAGSTSMGVIDLTTVFWTVLIGLAVSAVVSAVASSRVLHTRHSTVGTLRLGWFLPIVGLAVAAWIQVGGAQESGEIDPLVIAFPLVGLIAGVGLVVIGARWLMRRVGRTGASLPTALFLSWRRITSADSGAVLLATAMGIALGLVVFSTTLVDSLDTATDAKAVSVVGGATQARLDGRFDAELPEATTLVRVLSTRLTIGGDPVMVLAIDPATYAAGVSWDPAFGSSPAGLVDALATPVDADVAAVAVAGTSLPPAAGFGSTAVTSYEVVQTFDAVPLASGAVPTIVVGAPQIDAAARTKHDSQRPGDVDPEDWANEYRSPLARARSVLVSQLDEASLTAYAEANDVGVRELVTVAAYRDLVGNRAARWTFDYLGLLSVVAGLAAVGTLFFYLSEQRTNRQLSAVMAERMGLRPLTAAGAAVGEVLGLVVIAFVAGTSVGLAVARRLFDRFEPDPRLPPDVSMNPAWELVGAIAVVATVLVVAAALVNQWVAGKKTYGAVLRGT